MLLLPKGSKWLVLMYFCILLMSIEYTQDLIKNYHKAKQKCWKEKFKEIQDYLNLLKLWRIKIINIKYKLIIKLIIIISLFVDITLLDKFLMMKIVQHVFVNKEVFAYLNVFVVHHVLWEKKDVIVKEKIVELKSVFAIINLENVHHNYVPLASQIDQSVEIIQSF